MSTNLEGQADLTEEWRCLCRMSWQDEFGDSKKLEGSWLIRILSIQGSCSSFKTSNIGMHFIIDGM